MYRMLLPVVLSMQAINQNSSLKFLLNSSLYRFDHLSVVLLLVWALGGKVTLLVADKTLDFGDVKVLLTTILLLCLTLALPCQG